MASLKKIIRRGWKCESGAEFVEAALAFPLLLLIVLGIMDFGLMFQQYEVITNAAREGARIAVMPNYSTQDVKDRVTAYVNGSLLSTGGSVTTTVTPTSIRVGAASFCAVRVDVTYDHQFLFLSGIGTYFGRSFASPKTLKASSTMRPEIPASAGC